MSIYASWPAPDDDHHEEDCAVWDEDPPGSGIMEWTGEPCSCALPRAPIVYQGSHVLPSSTDERGGRVDIASIPGHITRDGRDDGPDEDVPWAFLRLGVNEETVVLDRAGVELVHRTLGVWLEATA